MKIVALSILRNSSKYFHRFVGQIAILEDHLTAEGNKFELILGDGDHIDNTRDMIAKKHLNSLDVSHGGPEHGSVVNIERFENLAYAWNKIWSTIPENSDIVIFLEADLIWDLESMIKLIKDMNYVDVVSPMIMHGGDKYPKDQFYDIWAFRRGGISFDPFPPYYYGMENTRGLLNVDSSGSCLLIRGDIARKVKFPSEDVIVGVCSQIRNLGYSIWVDTNVQFRHP